MTCLLAGATDGRPRNPKPHNKTGGVDLPQRPVFQPFHRSDGSATGRSRVKMA